MSAAQTDLAAEALPRARWRPLPAAVTAAAVQPAATAGSGPAAPWALDVQSLSMAMPSATIEVNDWRVAVGERVALIGRNGAGKTSILEALLGLREGARLQGQVLGEDMRRWRRHTALRARVGTQLQQASLPVWLRVAEMVDVHRSLFARTSADVLTALGIGSLMGKRYEWLSRGERQRVDLALALAHGPELALLDEPFSGLDPHYARACSELLGSQPGLTLLMCCHTVEELRLATRVAWIEHGVRRYATPQELQRELLGEYRLRVQCASAHAARALALELKGRLGAAAQEARVDDAGVSLFGGSELQPLVHHLVERDGLGVEFGQTGLQDLLQHCARSQAC